MNVIEVNNLAFGYKTPLHEEVSFLVKKGDKVLLKGLNGAGKSTLIRTLCGLENALGGTILIEGNEVQKSEISRIVTERFSVLLTNGLDASGLKVSEYFEMHQDKLKEEELEHFLVLFDVKKLWNKDMSEISDGEKQKVLLIKSLAKRAQLYLFDEPTTYLDYKTKDLFYDYVKNCNGKTFLISTHDIERMEPLVNKLILL